MNLVIEPAVVEYLKKYIGQADQVRRRVRNHRSEMKKGKSLHHRIARVETRVSNFVLLGKWTDDAVVPMAPALLDLVEMYFSLLFQSLPKRSLTKWLPIDVPLRKETGLNIALPLYQAALAAGSKKRAQLSFLDLKDSDDPEVRGYLKDAAAKGRASMAAQNWVPNSRGLRQISWKQEVLRGPLEDNDDEKHVEIECRVCKHKKMDPDPLFQKVDGKYVVREQICTNCPVKRVNATTGGITYQKKLHHPVDGRPRMSLTKVKKP